MYYIYRMIRVIPDLINEIIFVTKNRTCFEIRFFFEHVLIKINSKREKKKKKWKVAI